MNCSAVVVHTFSTSTQEAEIDKDAPPPHTHRGWRNPTARGELTMQAGGPKVESAPTCKAGKGEVYL